MSIGPFRVGDRPVDPLVLTVTREGDTEPLGGYTSAQVQMLDPVGDEVGPWTGTLDATAGTVTSTFPSPFARPGQHHVRVRLTGPAGIEHTGWARFWVRPLD